MAEFFDEKVRDEMKRKWMRLAMEAQEDGNTALANHYLKAAFVERHHRFCEKILVSLSQILSTIAFG